MGLHASPASDLVCPISHETLCSSEAVQMVSFSAGLFLTFRVTARCDSFTLAPVSIRDPIGLRLDTGRSGVLYGWQIKWIPRRDTVRGPTAGTACVLAWMGHAGCPHLRRSMMSP